VSEAQRDEAPAREDRAWLRGWPWLHLGTAAVALGWLYRGALSGPFFSDDEGLILQNPLTEGLSPAHLFAIFDPAGSQLVLTGTWAPLHMLWMALERAVFGLDPAGWHLVNVLLHALATCLVASLMLASGLAPRAALLCAALFGLHPAAVEGVAWISQSKTLLCAVFGFGALRAWRTRPALATALFAAALLAKPHALMLLPTAAAFSWVGPRAAGARPWRWLALWCALFALYALPETVAFREYSGFQAEAEAGLAERLRTPFAIAARYAAMAASGFGVAAFAQPDPPDSWLDPWFLAGAALCAALGLRALRQLRARNEEGAWWVFAAAGFAPVSQAMPFLFPIADRYLYFILPGLLGATALALADAAARIGAARGTQLGRGLTRAALAAGLALAALFAWRSEARARLWREPTLVFLDAARHYPDGYPAHFLRARSAALRGDAAGAVQALRAAHAKGLSDFMALAQDAALAPIAGSPEFAELLRELAQEFVAKTPVGPDTDQSTLHLLAHAHLLRGDPREAARAFDAAIRAGGLQDGVLRAELAQLLAADPPLRDEAVP
jgi:hypothetical protein